MHRRSLAGLAALVIALVSPATASAEEWTLVIHGGAGVIERDRLSAEREAQVREALGEALAAGGAILNDGGAALDAVEAAVRLLEDSPHFNAGRGAVFTAKGTNELDASIMDGASRAAGAVAGVTATRHPISLARAVMEDSPHVMLAGEGADAFSREQGLEQAAPEWFRTEERWRQWEALRARDGSQAVFDAEIKYGTVGAVARDKAGNLSAATSTGGITGKNWGRIGDSPLIGAGTYADNDACAVSATGSGEYYIRAAAAHAICMRMRHLDEDPQNAADTVQADIAQLGGTGGVIVLAPDGSHAFSFNTPGMYRGVARQGEEAIVAIYGDE